MILKRSECVLSVSFHSPRQRNRTGLVLPGVVAKFPDDPENVYETQL